MVLHFTPKGENSVVFFGISEEISAQLEMEVDEKYEEIFSNLF